MKIKKIVVLLTLIVFCFPCLFVNADEDSCTTYTNYYFFNEINDFDIVKNKVAKNEGVWQRRHATFYPNIHKVTEEIGMDRGKVCLGEETGCIKKWTLEDFYNMYKEIMTKGKKASVKIENLEEEYIVYTVTDEEGKEISYFLHSAWFETDENGEAITTSRSENVDYSSVATADLIKGSFIPTRSKPELDFTGDTNGIGYVEAKIERRIVASDYTDVTPFSLEWNSTSGSIQSVLTPALYFSEYELCGKEVKYEATIDYYKKGTTEKVADSWFKSDLSDGYKETVKSPIIEKDNEICEPDTVNVEVLIDGEDFYQPVYYSCTNNGKTGSAFIWVILFVAASSLGVGIWYYKKNKA